MDDKQRYAEGMAVRRKVLGEPHVDRATAAITPLTQTFQDFITRYAWGEVWSRPGLPHHTRSLLTLAITVALNREAEFKLHVRAAFSNGVTSAELEEVLLHTAIYCGLPAANTAFHWAEEVMAALAQESSNR